MYSRRRLVSVIYEGKDNMAYIYAAVGSVTTAARLSRELAKRGISASVMHTPPELDRGGCSYSVRVDEAYRSQLENAASGRRYKIRRLYMQDKGKDYYDLS